MKAIREFGVINALFGLLVMSVMALKVTPFKHADIVAVGGPVASVAGVLFGFVLAAITILSGMSGNSFIRKLKANNMLSPFLLQLNSTGLALILVCAFALLSMLLPGEEVTVFSTKLRLDWLSLSFSTGMMAASIASFVSCWRKLSGLIEVMAKL